MAGDKGRVEGNGTGLSLVQMQAKVMAEKMFTDMMAAGGVDHRRMAQELLFFLPRNFCDAYERLWYRGVAAKGTDGGSDQRGRSQEEAAKVGKAKGSGAGGMGKRRSHKKYWVIADEEALEIKDRVDKRLRGMAREIMRELAELDDRAVSGGRAGGNGLARERKAARMCDECGRLAGEGWKFCPNCGSSIDS